jgi:hypothetical protein
VVLVLAELLSFLLHVLEVSVSFIDLEARYPHIFFIFPHSLLAVAEKYIEIGHN